MTEQSTHKDLASRHNDSAEYPFLLEITRGRTQNPLRPITHERFLIGAGERCDLRLGGSEMPPLHSILYVDGVDAWIDAIADDPELKVNGLPTRSAHLADGDQLEVGTFQLALRDTGAESPPPILQAFSADDFETEAEVDPSTLSPAELIELIEQEEELIEEFEARKRMGIETLMRTLHESQPDAEPLEQLRTEQRPDTERPRDLLVELEAAISSLTRFAEELEQRASRLSHQDFQRTAATLVDFQQQIIGRLDAVLAKVTEGHKPNTSAKPLPSPQHRRDVA